MSLRASLPARFLLSPCKFWYDTICQSVPLPSPADALEDGAGCCCSQLTPEHNPLPVLNVPARVRRSPSATQRDQQTTDTVGKNTAIHPLPGTAGDYTLPPARKPCWEIRLKYGERYILNTPLHSFLCEVLVLGSTS